ncbi:MAG: hypothetical protein QNK23_01260 [Crocinitomicaceae bacterium]|nr:hypothetical protein [Crocinitomicaceae bacterium]
MKWIYALVLVLITTITFGQRDLTPSNRRQAFGSRDTRTLNPYGLQIQLGGTFLMSKLKNETHEVESTTGSFRGNYSHDPFGKLGGYVEIGMFHFPKKRSKLSLWMKTVLVSYYDWGIGFKYFRGGEDTQINFVDPITGSTSSLDPSERNLFEFGHVFARFSLHKNIHFKNRDGDKSNFFLDNGLGINVDYRVTTKSEFTTAYPITTVDPGHNYSSPLFAQIHYSLGLGFKLKRGSYLIPGVRLPLLGYQMIQEGAPSNSVSGRSVFGNPSIQWFSAKHWPILFTVKYMFAFEKKNKGDCPAVGTNDQDRETQRNR